MNKLLLLIVYYIIIYHQTLANPKCSELRPGNSLLFHKQRALRRGLYTYQLYITINTIYPDKTFSVNINLKNVNHQLHKAPLSDYLLTDLKTECDKDNPYTFTIFIEQELFKINYSNNETEIIDPNDPIPYIKIKSIPPQLFYLMAKNL